MRHRGRGETARAADVTEGRSCHASAGDSSAGVAGPDRPDFRGNRRSTVHHSGTRVTRFSRGVASKFPLWKGVSGPTSGQAGPFSHARLVRSNASRPVRTLAGRLLRARSSGGAPANRNARRPSRSPPHIPRSFASGSSDAVIFSRRVRPRARRAPRERPRSARGALSSARIASRSPIDPHAC